MSIIKKIAGLKNGRGFTKHLKNVSWLVGEKILRMIVGLFVGVWVARFLGPAQFGLFNYAQSVVLLFSAFASLGLDGIVVRELVVRNANKDELIGTALILKLFGAFSILLLITTGIFFRKTDDQSSIIIFIIASANLFQSFNVIDFYFQSKVLSRFVVYSNVLSLLLSSIIKIISILYQAPLIVFAYISVFDSFILASGFILFYIKGGGRILNWSFSKKLAFSLLRDSWPLILSSFVVSIYMKVDQIMIKSLLNLEAVGQYAAATRLSEAWYFIPVVISASLFPAIINAKNISKELYIERFQMLNDFMVLMAVGIAILGTFLSEWVVHFLYGSEYGAAGSVLVIHIWAGIFVFMTVCSGRFLTAENMTRKILYRNLSGLIVNIVLNVLFIPKYGIQGAAFATLASWIVSGYIYDLCDNELRYMFVLKTKSFNFFRLFSLVSKGSR